MDTNAVMQAVASVGFPVAMCIYLTHYMQTEQKEMREAITKLEIAILSLTERINKDDKR